MLGLDESTAFRDLAPLLAPLDSALRAGWSQYTQERLGKPFGKRTRACMVNDFQVALVRQRLGDMLQDVQLNQQVYFLFQQRYALRIKLLDSQLHSRNQLTRQVLAFRRQEQLPGMPETYNLEVGYVLNPLQTEIRATHLVYPMGKRAIGWQVPLDAGAGHSAQASVLPLKVPEPSGAAGVILRPKRRDQEPNQHERARPES